MQSNSSDIHFIIGAPYSGARRLMHALNGHPSIFATENQLFGGFFDARAFHPRAKKGPRITFDRYVQAFADHFPFKAMDLERREFMDRFMDQHISMLCEFIRRESGKEIILDTIVPYPGTSRRIIDTLDERFPNAKVVYVSRDGRDVVTEATFDFLAHDGHGTDRYAFFVENRPNVVLNRFFDDHALSVWGKNWSEVISIQSRLRPTTLMLEYDELVQSGSESLERILEFLSIQTPCPEELRKLGPGQLTERPSTKHIRESMGEAANDWRGFFTLRDAKLFEEVAGRQLRKAGFETNENWGDSLPKRLELSMT